MIRYASCVWELPMPTTFRAYQPDQPLLLPPDLQEWVPPGHLAHHVSDVVDALDLTAFYAPYEGDGRRNAPYEPSMMSVAGAAKDSAMVARDQRVDDLAARGQGLERPLLVGAHEPAVARHVGGEDGRQPPCHAVPRHAPCRPMKGSKARILRKPVERVYGRPRRSRGAEGVAGYAISFGLVRLSVLS